MASYFVCEEGPMGGIEIVFEGEERADCDKFVRARPGRKFYIYELQTK